jgi:RimJ/RimL family protein N-acetyltransferase
MTVFIEGLRTRLRPLTNTDIGPRYLGWVNDYEVTKYLVGLLFPVTEGDFEGYLSRFEDSKSNFAFAIIDKESDVHIGNVTLNHIN